MSTYKEIHGKAIKSVSTDLSSTNNTGQIWYNTTTNTFKSIVNFAAWSSSTPLTTGRLYGSGFGTQTAAVAAGGRIPSPAGGVLVLMPLIYSYSEIQILNPNYQVIVPILFIIISILLISKIPTYSLKKIVVPRSTTIFLLFVVILYFGLLLIYTFNTLIISGILYLLMIPVSAVHYLIINKNNNVKSEDFDHHEDVL